MARDVRVVLVDEEVVMGISSLASRGSIRRAIAGAREEAPAEVEGRSVPEPRPELRDAICEVLASEEKRRERREAEGQEAERATVVTVFGVTRGMGKTTLATNLALGLAMVTRQKVALLDLDLRSGDAARMMNVVPRRSLTAVAGRTHQIEGQTMKESLVRHESGVMLLASRTPATGSPQISGAQTRRLLQELAGAFDYVIVDTPAALNESVVTALEMSTLILMLTTIPGRATAG